jgi:nicotinate-nucleotide adenylyltransferase
MLIGEDMFLSLDTWRAPDEIMELATIVALRRKDGDLSVMEAKAEEYKSRYGAKIILIGDEPIEVSSTPIRNMIADGKDTGDLLPKSVLEYIKEHNLYKNEN